VFPALAETTEPSTTAAESASANAQATGDAVAADAIGAYGLLGRLVRLRPKSLLLTPSTQQATDLADDLQIPQHLRFTASDDEAVGDFVAADAGTLLAANRYDGMDLPGDACRVQVLSGLPDALHLLDRFLITRLKAENVLLERVRTRVLQGAGRCTRGPQDWALVVVDGPDLFKFLCRTEVRTGLPAELQAEIAFGLQNSAVPDDVLLELAESALTRDEIWQQDAEPAIVDLHAGMARHKSPDADALAASAAHEIAACNAAWTGDWDAASRAAVEVLGDLAAPPLRPYQSLWAYLGAAWAQRAADEGAAAAGERATELLRRARTAAAGTTWLREVEPRATAALALEPVDEQGVVAAAGLTATAAWFRSPTRFDRLTSEMIAGLTQTKAGPYERGLATLGQLLGAEAHKPQGDGRADSVWLWDALWLTLEAKTEQTSEGLVSHDYVRQTNGHLKLLVADRDLEKAPEGSASIIVSPRPAVHPDGVTAAEPHLHLTTPQVMLGVALDVVAAWKRIRGAIVDTMGDDARRTVVAEAFDRRRVLPSQIRERLTQQPVHG
jgi:hypothetical protein